MSDRLALFKQLLSSGVTLQKCLFCCGDDNLMITRGATKSQSFNLPFDVNVMEDFVITYKQGDDIVIEKTQEDVTIASFDSTLLYYSLNESETMRFKPDQDVKVQLKGRLQNNDIIDSEIFTIAIVDNVSDKYLSNESIQQLALIGTVNLQSIEISQLMPLYTGSYNYYKCKFNFDSTWLEFTDKKAVFKDQHGHLEHVDLIEDECIIPANVLEKAGCIYVAITSECDGTTKPTRWSNSLRVKVGSIAGDNIEF